MRPAGPRATTPRPATTLHARAVPAKGRALDLRSTQLDPPAEPELPVKLHPESLVEARAHATADVPAILPSHHETAPPPKATVREKQISLASDRLDRAKEVPKSQHISKFGHHFPKPGEGAPKPGEHQHFDRFEERFAGNFAPEHQAIEHQELPSHVVTQHQAMQHLAPQPHLAAQPGPHRAFAGPRSSQLLTIGAIIAIMGGYIWLQNYPKLAVRSVSHSAGIAATLPGYVPSSYSLSRTDAKPGLVSFKFTSPSQTEALTINQQRTTWDSSSLLDNFITKQATNYSAIEGQGLTIYLYNQNKAAWVNQGIWYQISGAGRLSRDQVLKIAYSF